MARPVLYGEEYNTLIQNHGITCDYHPAIVCECITKDSQQPLFTCPKCGGSGYRYLPSSRIKVVVTSFATRTEPEMMSFRESGTAYATPEPDVIMGFHDRLVFPDFKCKYSERLWIKAGETVTSKSYRNIKDVISVIKDTTEFEAGVDFTVSNDEYHIEFVKPIDELLGIDLTELEDSQIPISILYYTTPSYLVADVIHELRSHYTVRNTPFEKFEELPKQYRLKREDFIYDVKTEEELEDEVPDEEYDTEDSLYD